MRTRGTYTGRPHHDEEIPEQDNATGSIDTPDGFEDNAPKLLFHIDPPVLLTIDYAERRGPSSKRQITASAVLEGHSGQLIINAYCHLRQVSRHFPLARIEAAQTASGIPLTAEELLDYLTDRSSDIAPEVVDLNAGFYLDPPEYLTIDYPDAEGGVQTLSVIVPHVYRNDEGETTLHAFFIVSDCEINVSQILQVSDDAGIEIDRDDLFAYLYARRSDSIPSTQTISNALLSQFPEPHKPEARRRPALRIMEAIDDIGSAAVLAAAVYFWVSDSFTSGFLIFCALAVIYHFITRLMR